MSGVYGPLFGAIGKPDESEADLNKKPQGDSVGNNTVTPVSEFASIHEKVRI
jgi:hypothetical protein